MSHHPAAAARLRQQAGAATCHYGAVSWRCTGRLFARTQTIERYGLAASRRIPRSPIGRSAIPSLGALLTTRPIRYRGFGKPGISKAARSKRQTVEAPRQREYPASAADQGSALDRVLGRSAELGLNPFSRRTDPVATHKGRPPAPIGTSAKRSAATSGRSRALVTKLPEADATGTSRCRPGIATHQ